MLFHSLTAVVALSVVSTVTAAPPSGCPADLKTALDNVITVFEHTYNTTHDPTAIQALFSPSSGFFWYDGTPAVTTSGIPSLLTPGFAATKAVTGNIRECDIFHAQTEFSASWVILDFDFFAPDMSVTHVSFLGGVTYEDATGWLIMFWMGLPIGDAIPPSPASASASASASATSSFAGSNKNSLRGNAPSDLNVTAIMEYQLYSFSTEYATAFASGSASKLAPFYGKQAVLQTPNFPILQGFSNIEQFYSYLIASGVSNLDLSFWQGGFSATENYIFAIANWVSSSNGLDNGNGQTFIVWSVGDDPTSPTIYRQFLVSA